MMDNDRYFSPEPSQRNAARELYEEVSDLPLVCPHGHVDPQIFVDPDFQFRSPTHLLITPDHYILRMLYSQGYSLQELGIHQNDGGEVETDPRQIWQIFADNFHLFQGTPTGIWLADEFSNVFDITEKFTGENAQDIYNHIDNKLKSPEFTPRRMFERFNIEVLCTTDAATDTLPYHKAVQESDWNGRVLPTFCPDALTNINNPNWLENIRKLSQVSGTSIINYPTFITAIENRRIFFQTMGAKASDHDVRSPLTLSLTAREADDIFQRALMKRSTPEDASRFTANMLVEMARMSSEDGLVMQLHVGSYRDHNPTIASTFGSDMGTDIPVTSEFTRNLKTLLDRFGNDPDLTLIIFTLDETAYARELAPLAGHYPVLKLGSPWWFNDSINGLRRYFDRVMETAGIYNTVGFNDDTSALPSIPARHNLWRRAVCDWAAGLLVRHIIDEEDARQIVRALAYDLAIKSYKL